MFKKLDNTQKTLGLIALILILLLIWKWDAVMNWFQSFGDDDKTNQRLASTVNLSMIPQRNLNTLTGAEKNLISAFFNNTNRNGVSDQSINQVNSDLSKIGSGVSFYRNNATAKAKCKEGQDCWSLNLLIFTMCRCKSYGTQG